MPIQSNKTVSHFTDNTLEKETGFMNHFLKNYQNEIKNTSTTKPDSPKKSKFQSIKIVYQLAKKCRTQSPIASRRALVQLIRLRSSRNYQSKKLAISCLRNLLKSPLILTIEHEKRALRAVDRCFNAYQTDDLLKRRQKLKNLVWLKQSNSKIVRLKAIGALKKIKKMPLTHSDEQLQRALISIERLKKMVLNRVEKSNDYFLRLLNLTNSCSPTVQQESNWAVEICLSRAVRAK